MAFIKLNRNFVFLTTVVCLFGFGLSAHADCVRAIQWAVRKLEDSDATRPPPRVINESKKEEWKRAQPEAFRDVFSKLADSITHISHETFLEKLYASIDHLANALADEETVYFYFAEETGRSNKWVFHLMTDYLIKNKPEFLYKIVELNSPAEAREARPEQIVFVDDASYSGYQVAAGIKETDGNRVRKVHVVIPFVSQAAENFIRNPTVATMVLGRPVEFVFHAANRIKTVMEIAAEQGIEPRMINFMFPQHAPLTTLTYFDHKVPDQQSSLPLSTDETYRGGNRLLLAGAVAVVGSDGRPYMRFPLSIPFLDVRDLEILE